MKRTVSLALALIISLSVFSGGCTSTAAKKPEATSKTKPQLVSTTVTGVASAITVPSQKKLKRTIKVSPSNGGRTVRLQLYINSSKSYKTVKTYKTEDSKTAQLTILFPKKYRKKRTGKWRIVVLKTDKAKQAVKKVKITSKNIVTKKLTCKTACIYCADDKKVVYDLGMNKQRAQASTTKIMTSILLLESGKLGGTSTISKKSSKTPYSHPVMKEGDVCANKDLLYTLLLPSSNGAAVAVAENIGGSVSGFVGMMNEKAKDMGLKNTRFVTPHGLDEKGHYSSAYDICLELAYIYPKSPNFRKVIASSTHTFTTKKYKTKYTVETTDMLKGYSDKHMGGKTGTTTNAGNCFASVYVHEGKTYTVAMLGAPTDEERWSNTKTLYSYIDEYANTQY